MKDAPHMDNSQRIAKLSTLLKAADCPAIAFVPGPNFYYLTGVSLALMERPTILIITAEGDAHAAIPARWSVIAGRQKCHTRRRSIGKIPTDIPVLLQSLPSKSVANDWPLRAIECANLKLRRSAPLSAAR